MKSILIAALTPLVLAAPAAAQELIAWPVGSASMMRVILPGVPVRPLPPRPIPTPFPRPVPTPPPPDARPLAIAGYRVSGSVIDKVAELEYEVTFNNPTNRRLEGVMIMPLPANTVMSGFTMTVGGKKMSGELLNATEARTVYQNIVRRMQDPGLLELVGERMIRARVFPIMPRSNIIVRLKASQILPRSGGLYSLAIPLHSSKMTGSEKGAGNSVRLSLSSAKPIRTLYSPAPGVKIERSGDRAATIEFDSREKTERDLTLFYSLQENPLAAGILNFKQEGEDGTFLLSLSPKREAGAKALPKDIVFIIDRSGSMEEGGKMTQAKEALKFCVSKLRAEDRFGIVDFATDTNLFETRLVGANKGNKARALRYIARMEAAGGTNIERALDDGLKLLGPRKSSVPMIFFMTDGLPTVGQTNMDELLRAAARRNDALRARLFSFGVGDDVNTLFLDKLAGTNRGAGDYVRPGESIEAKVGALYTKVAKPALTDVNIRWEGVETRQVYPKRVTDIFYGAELMLMGRYKGHGQGRLVVTGKAAGKNVRFVYPVEFAKEAARYGFLPRLWANLKVTNELDALRLAGGSPGPETINSIVRLAKRYGIVTPYTSYLITEEGFDLAGARRAADGRIRRMRENARRSGSGGGAFAPAAQDASSFFSRTMGAVRGLSPMISGATSGMEEDERIAIKSGKAGEMSFLMAKAEKKARKDMKNKGFKLAETRSVGGKTFYLRGETWVDGTYETFSAARRRTEVKIRFLSKDYFSLLESHPGLGRYLALGRSVVVVLGGTVYRIGK